jgi:saccharopine dehydrogenase-like NADP-dependent oxidoreductase
MPTTVLLLGAGKIGRMIARLLIDTGDYNVRVADVEPAALSRVKQQTPAASVHQLDAESHEALLELMQGCRAVISALSFRHNPAVARAALEAGISYFDLTEDRETTAQVRAFAEQAKPGQVFVPQCGLAPGFISIVASHLIKRFEKLDTVRMRVGALPQFPTNALTYNLTWSTDGLINEYCNPCEVIYEGKRLEVPPLEGLERFSLNGIPYEAFQTSGGLGSLCETLESRVRELNYKTIRYPGHHELMVFLLRELRLEDRRDLLKNVLETAIPVTFQDVVVIFCTVTGMRRGQFVQHSDARFVYPCELQGEAWSAIQITTAAALCAVLDLHISGVLGGQGFIKQEEIGFEPFIQNRFGAWYEDRATNGKNV